tara:strand:- start:1078 stop:1455 length:378 start_codon:yes stop_codon:yes gene_type:complete
MPTVRTHITNHTTQKSYASVQDADTTPSENLLSEQSGRVYSIFLEYDNATVGYFKLYDAKGSLTHGTDVPIFVVPVKGTTCGISIMSQTGVLISNGLSVAGSAKGGTGAGGAVPAGTIDAYITGT